MPKKGKVGKQRKDKFYKLAKETGYRSRASFKLLQLNRKFEFLPKSRVLIDLCAAPGGWLQVAQQAMPVSSVIIGVDLVPIKPIPNVITLQEDITTDKCRQSLKRQLKTWKADVVLNDGAPNVGKNWIQDAFTQNGLTLSALKLATEMLVKGGWFVTKVFRSKDYLSLVWIFKKLFKQVHVTKPQASRNESAEIFVVCQGYLAPERLDPRFLDPGYLFKDVQSKEETKSKILEVTHKKPKAEGYDDDEPLHMHRTLNATDFIFCENHLERLSNCIEVVFNDEDIENHKLTTEEIKQCCKDIKVLGKAELKMLLNWRKQLRTILEKAAKKEEKDIPVEKVVPDEEEELDDVMKEAEELELSKLQEAKRKKKKILKERKKLHERLNLKMIIKDDEPIIEEDRELFQLKQIKNKNALKQVEDETNLEFGLEAPQLDDDILQPGYKSTFMSYNRHIRDDSRVEAEPEKEESEYSSDEGLSSEMEFESESEKEEDKEVTENILHGKKNPLMVDLVERPDRVKDTVDRWFDKADFASENDDSDLELDLLAEEFEKKQKVKKGEIKDDSASEEEKDDSISQSTKENKAAKKDKKRKRVKLDPEGLALGSLIVQSKKMKRDIIENGYNRFASNDEKLPDWFVRDEKKHYRKQLPVSAELIAEYKQRLKEINARPIKKIVEAKARKKRRSIRRMEKAKKRAEKVTEHPDMTISEKADQLKEIYKKATPKQDKKVTYIVAKKGVGRRVSRPAGVKGRFKVVDHRMKKDARKEKIAMKSKKNKKPSKPNFKNKGHRKR